MNIQPATTIALDDVWRQPLRLPFSDRRSHLLIVGKTGVGKSTLLTRLILDDLVRGRGLIFLDPHGQAAEGLLDLIPPRRTDDVAYFDPSDTQWPVGFNILANVPKERRHLVVSGVVHSCKAIWGDSWGPRLEYLLGNAVATLLELPGSTLLGIPRLLTDKNYRDRAMERVSDPRLQAFWREEYAAYSDRLQAEASAPVLNKIGQFLMSPAIRNIVGRTKNSIDLRYVMDNRRILIANLSKGKMGADKAQLIGSLLVTQCQLVAMSRIDIVEDDRVDCYMYVDEFQNFANDSFADILSEARKFHLNLTIAHQYIDQLSAELRNAVFGNVGSIVAFKVGSRDAEFLAREFGHDITPSQLIDLDRYKVCVALAREGITTQARPGKALPLVAERYGKGHNIIEQSRMRFAKPRNKIEPLVLRQLR